MKAKRLTRLSIDREGKITNIRGREINPSAVLPIGEPFVTWTLGIHSALALHDLIRQGVISGDLSNKVNAYSVSDRQILYGKNVSTTKSGLDSGRFTDLITGQEQGTANYVSVQLYELNERKR